MLGVCLRISLEIRNKRNSASHLKGVEDDDVRVGGIVTSYRFNIIR